MKKIVQEFYVYNYSELSEDAKIKVKQDYLDDSVRAEDLSFVMKNDLKNLFPESDLDVQWSLASCQGDGVNIFGTLNLKDLISLPESDRAGIQFSKWKGFFSNKELRALDFYLSKTGPYFELPENSRYTYCMADRNNFARDYWFTLDSDYWLRGINEKLLQKVERMITGVIGKICCDYEDYGYEYLYEVSDEEMEDISDVNEWMYYEDGRLYA